MTTVVGSGVDVGVMVGCSRLCSLFCRPDRNLLVRVFVSRTTVYVERLITRPDHDRSDDNSTEHVLVLSRVVSILIKISAVRIAIFRGNRH